MTLSDTQIDSLNEVIILNVASLLEHPHYEKMPNNMLFGTFQNLPAPFGNTIKEWVGDAIMMASISHERQNNGEEDEHEFSEERMIEITKKLRDQTFIDKMLLPFLTMDKADIMKKNKEIFRKYSGGRGR